MNNAIYSCILFFVLGFLGCGPDLSEEREYDNPNDPNRKIAEEHPEAQATEGSHAASEAVSTKTAGASESRSGAEGSACLLGGCNPPANTAFNFANVFEAMPEGCSDAQRVKVFDVGTSLDVFVQANCGVRPQVFHYTASYSGIALTSPINVSASCDSGSFGVTDFVAARGDSNYLVSYSCRLGSIEYTTYVVPVEFDGSAGSAALYESYTSSGSSRPYFLAWNPVAATFGLARTSKFQRFNHAGGEVGGPITISTYAISTVESFDGSWLIIHASNFGGTHCSRISSVGTLQCNQLAIASGFAGFIDKQTMIRSNRTLSDGYSLYFKKSDFDVAECKTSGESAAASVVNREATVSQNIISGALKLNSSYGGILYQTRSNLVLATIPLTGAFSVLAESSVTGFTSLSNSNLLKANNRVYVSYVKDGSAYVAYSDETLD